MLFGKGPELIHLLIHKYSFCDIEQVISVLQMNLEWFIYAVFIKCLLWVRSHDRGMVSALDKVHNIGDF